MFERLTGDARTVVRHGEEQARQTGARVIEAEHLLLAIAVQDGSAEQRLLTDVGLTHARILQLVQEEHGRSLAFAGITPPRGRGGQPLIGRAAATAGYFGEGRAASDGSGGHADAGDHAG